MATKATATRSKPSRTIGCKKHKLTKSQKIGWIEGDPLPDINCDAVVKFHCEAHGDFDSNSWNAHKNCAAARLVSNVLCNEKYVLLN